MKTLVPVLLFVFLGAHSLALRAAGITKETPDPPGGTIVRDARGEPTGILKDAAMEPVYAIIPDMSEEEITEALRAYTMGSAYASFDEKSKGSIEPGKVADIATARVVMTVFDGRIIYERP